MRRVLFILVCGALAMSAASEGIVPAAKSVRVIRGVIVDGETGTGIAGAKITTGNDGETITARNGRFELAARADKWPKQLMVEAVGFGSRVIAIPAARADTSLDDIYLRRAASVLAEIYQTEPGQVVQVDLVRLRNDGRAPGPVMQTLRLARSKDVIRSLRFENVDAGQYAIHAKGMLPSELAGTRVDVRVGDTPTAIVQITPFRLRLRAALGGESIGTAHVTLRQQDAFWETKLETGPNGEVTATLWQTGPLTAMVMARDVVPYRLRRTITEPLDGEWLLDVPQLEVIGSVVDAETGAPIANAALSLEMKAGTQLLVNGKAEKDGRFRFAPVSAGMHTLKAVAPDYPVTEMSYSFGENETSHSVTIALERMPATRLLVVDSRGSAVAGANVYAYRGQTRTAFGRTGGDGQIPLFMREGESRDVFVVPADGSLGVARVSSGTKKLTIRLPEPGSRIIVRAESEAREPIPHMTVDVRYNGYLLPDDVMEAFYTRGSRLSSGENGLIVLELMPAGVYEITPVVPRWARGAQGAIAAPIRLNTTAGENVVAMTFATTASTRP
jgi:hypothetical protein